MESGYYEPELHEFRAKHLDKEDIESFGFRITKDYSDTYIFQSAIEDVIHGEYWYEIYCDKETYITTIEKWTDANGDNRSSREQLFRGLIRNKSELSIILKQVGVS